MHGKMRTMFTVPLIALLVFCGMLLTAAPEAGAAPERARIAIDGSTTVGPVAKAFREYYKSKNPEVTITVSETGSGNGARSLINGSCQIANMSRMMKVKEYRQAVENNVQPVAHVVAMDGIAVAVHPSNPVSELSLSQLRDIYTGRISNWRELGGPNREIVVVSRHTTSGTYEVFGDIVLKGQKESGVEYVPSNGAARSRVTSTQAAIAYVGLGFLQGVKPVAINGVKPTLQTVGAGQYPIARPLFMWTDGYPEIGGHVHQFINIHLSRDGQQIIEDIGFVPLTQY